MLVRVFVGVSIGVLVRVVVGVSEGVFVLVRVGVSVGGDVGVRVDVDVRVLVGVFVCVAVRVSVGDCTIVGVLVGETPLIFTRTSNEPGRLPLTLVSRIQSDPPTLRAVVDGASVRVTETGFEALAATIPTVSKAVVIVRGLRVDETTRAPGIGAEATKVVTIVRVSPGAIVTLIVRGFQVMRARTGGRVAASADDGSVAWTPRRTPSTRATIRMLPRLKRRLINFLPYKAFTFIVGLP